MSVPGVIALVVAVVAATAWALVRRWRAGRLRVASAADAAVTAASIGDDLGERATLLQFSSAFCRPCVATRHVLGRVAETVPGVRHVEVDAESRLDLVRLLGIASTPTTLLVDGDGVVRRRATGVPRHETVLAALAELTDQ